MQPRGGVAVDDLRQAGAVLPRIDDCTSTLRGALHRGCSYLHAIFVIMCDETSWNDLASPELPCGCG